MEQLAAGQSFDNAAYTKDNDKEVDKAIVSIDPANLSSSDIQSKRKSFEGKTSEKIDENDDSGNGNRDTWDNPLEFLLSCISMSVGLGNVWRFPGVAARNGGGAFLIPYFIVLLIIGRPLYYLEMCMGQFSRFGHVKVWNMAPICKGVGYGSTVAVTCICSYYCYLIAIAIYLLVASFAKTLPWAECHQEKHPNISCDSPEAQGNLASLYYSYTVNPQLENVDNGIGSLNWQLAICLGVSWLVILLSLVKGVKSSGKVAYFTAIFPYVVLLILFIRGVTLEGAWKGIRIFLEPQWDALIDPKVWYAAVEQCFFSLSVSLGPVIMLSSFNSFKRDIYKDAMIISFMDTFTSVLSGVTIFSVIGNIMYKNDLEFDQIEGIGGPDLAFILYPQAIATFDWAPQFFAVLFFLMLFTLGIGSATSCTGGVITIICDQYPNLKRWLVTIVVCTTGFLIGLMYTTEGGMMLLNLIEHYGAGFVIYVMGTLECAGVAYIYGLNNWCIDLEFMLGRKVGIYWKLCWGLILPIGLSANLLYYLISEPEFTSDGVPYPKIATILGWILTALAVGLIPGWALHAILTRKGNTLKEKFYLAMKPTHRWGPQDPKLRQEWLDFHAMKKAEGSKNRFLIF